MKPTAHRVLVIDDEVKFCALVKTFLAGRGYEVATASTTQDALLQIEQFHPDVVLMDILMPGLSGLELLKLIRDQAFPPRVIMVTASEKDEMVQQAMRDGAEAYVCKPIELETLDRLISRVWPSLDRRSGWPP